MEFNYKDSANVSEKDVDEIVESLAEYTKQIDGVEDGEYFTPESFLRLPYDGRMITKVLDLAKKKKTDNLKYVIVVGIGGSNLGAKAVYDAIYGFTDITDKNRYPKMIFADTNDSDFISSIKNLIKNDISKRDEIMVVVITKSGETTETIANAEVIISSLREKFEVYCDRIVAITNHPPHSKFSYLAEEKGIEKLEIPEHVGGRYSVFSAAGLFPLALVGIDIKKLLDGAGKNNKDAVVSAAILYLNLKDGKEINDLFVFHSELESFGKWYKQLIGESLGKNEEMNMLPTVSIGSTDLHSLGQLYLGGPKNRITTFVTSKDDSTIKIEKNREFTELVPSISGKTLSQIVDAISEGTKKAYSGEDLPFMEVKLKNISEYSIGQFMQFKMREVLYLGKLLNVNVFDQPDVELYKKETKDILEDK